MMKSFRGEREDSENREEFQQQLDGPYEKKGGRFSQFSNEGSHVSHLGVNCCRVGTPIVMCSGHAETWGGCKACN